jgi:hypothetical protein
MNAGAARDEEAGAGFVSIEVGKAEEPGSGAVSDGDRVAEDDGNREPAQAWREGALRHK